MQRHQTSKADLQHLHYWWIRLNGGVGSRAARWQVMAFVEYRIRLNGRQDWAGQPGGQGSVNEYTSPLLWYCMIRQYCVWSISKSNDGDVLSCCCICVLWVRCMIIVRLNWPAWMCNMQNVQCNKQSLPARQKWPHDVKWPSKKFLNPIFTPWSFLETFGKFQRKKLLPRKFLSTT